MADIAGADAFHQARGNVDWPTTTADKSAALLRAGDYIAAHYNLKPTLSDAEQVRLDNATYILALELSDDKKVPALRASAPVTKSDREMSGAFGGKIITEYGDAPIDPYPDVTAWLAALGVSTAPAGIIVGTLSL
ncbi:hypothetical protein [Sphingomonas oryzagri]